LKHKVVLATQCATQYLSSASLDRLDLRYTFPRIH